MPVSIHDFIDVPSKARHLGCTSDLQIAILPRNFATAETADQLLHESNAATIRTLFRIHNITETRIEPPEARIPFVQENDFTWIGPLLFFAASQITQNPDAIALSLGVIANYLTDFFRGRTDTQRVTLDVVVEQSRTKKSVRVHYDGNVDGLKELREAVMEVVRDENASDSISEQAK